jgi:hypothetical protein
MSIETQISQLEERIQELEREQRELRAQLAQAELDQWQGRLEDLEVQIHLGSMEAGDRLKPVLEALRNRWLDAQKQFNDMSSIATDVADSLRAGFQDAMQDLRDAATDAKSSVTSS